MRFNMQITVLNMMKGSNVITVLDKKVIYKLLNVQQIFSLTKKLELRSRYTNHTDTHTPLRTANASGTEGCPLPLALWPGLPRADSFAP